MFDNSNYNSITTLAQFILLGDGNFFQAKPSIKKILRFAYHTFQTDTIFNNYLINDSKAIDVHYSYEAIGQIGIDNLSNVRVSATASTGLSSHAVITVCNNNKDGVVTKVLKLMVSGMKDIMVIHILHRR
ncbi:MAG: hypothetical protein R2764_12840 [Bacteroidales bacterium]